MSTYGTIPTSSTPKSSPLTFLSRAKSRGRSALATRRPWRQLVHLHAFSLPPSLSDSYLRIRSNAAYFAMNYTILLLLILFLSLLWHPISLIVFIAMMLAWLFLYFLRDDPVVVLGRTINDLYVIILLSLFTLLFLFLTDVTLNILISLLVGVVVVLLHAVLRRTDDLFGDEEVGPGGWFEGGGEVGGSSRIGV